MGVAYSVTSMDDTDGISGLVPQVSVHLLDANLGALRSASGMLRLRRVVQDFHLGIAGNGGLCPLVHFLRDGAVEVVLAAVFADIGRHIADDHYRLPTLQRNGHCAPTSRTILAENARHGSL